jgi:hypothetical protein
MSDSDAAQEILKRIMAMPEPRLWSLGNWLQHEETLDDRAWLDALTRAAEGNPWIPGTT